MMLRRPLLALVSALALAACANPAATDGLSPPGIGQDPDSAEVVSVDRFSNQAGTFFRREQNPALPGPDEPIDMDAAPFKLSAFAPDGHRVTLYHLDARPTSPANLYIFFKKDGSPLVDQLYVFDALPGEPGYNDFCAIQHVTVPDNYVTNSITSRQDLEARIGEGFVVEATGKILDMPVVPAGSKATLGGKVDGGKDGAALLLRGWCRHKVLYYFAFDELQATPEGLVPTAPMYAFFAENGLPHRGGFRTMGDEGDTRNVLAIDATAQTFSPLWALQRLPQEDFTNVSNLSDVQTKLHAPPVAYGSTTNLVVVQQ